MMNPEVILLDEPTASLDLDSKNNVYKIIKELYNENKTIIIVSHDYDFLNKICNKIFNLQNSNLTQKT